MTTRTPYQRAAGLYVAAGWSPIPIATEGQGKGKTPGGCSGYSGEMVTDANLDAWLERAGTRYPNLALRLPTNVLGVDVDAYGIKKGGRQLELLQDDLGYLPPTWSSTARGPGQPARIYFFRVPGEHKYKIPKRHDIDLIQFHHRQAVVWPSPHHTGAGYWWYRPDGTAADEAELPTPDDLAELPARWVDRLRSARRSSSDRTVRTAVSANASTDELDAELERLYGMFRPTIATNSDLLDERLEPLRTTEPGSRHDVLLEVLGKIGDDIAAGKYPPRKATEDAIEAFEELIGDERDAASEARHAAVFVLTSRAAVHVMLAGAR